MMLLSRGCFVVSLHVIVWIGHVSSQGDKYLLSTNGGSQIWGHAYVKRSQTGLATTTTRPRSWVDGAFSLPVGRVVRFYAYVNRIAPNSSTSTSSNSSTVIRFQVWYSVNTTQYRLLYEKRTTVDNTEGVIQVEADPDVYTVSYCRLGWTSDSSIIPISFDFVDPYPLYYRTVNDVTDFPAVGQLYTNFNPNPYPALFSVAVEIDPRLIGATGATGSTGPPSGGNGTGSSGMGATGATGPPGPPGPAGPPGYGADGQVGSGGNGIDYTRCANITSPSGSGDCAQVRCNDTNTTSSCRCFRGYQLQSDGRSCSDIDECLYANGGCAINCTNTIGSFYCGCPPGLNLAPNEEDCLDVDECLNITCNQVCVNTFGSYECLRVIDAIYPKQGQPLESSDAQGSESLKSSVALTGVLVWMAILTLLFFLLAIVFLFLWRRKLRGSSVSPPSAESIDGRSIAEDSCASFAEFSDWKFGSVGDKSKKKRSFHCATILNLGEDNPAVEQNSKL